MTGNESISRIKLSGGPEQTVSSIYFDARDATVFEFFDFSPAAQEHFGNDIAIAIVVARSARDAMAVALGLPVILRRAAMARAQRHSVRERVRRESVKLPSLAGSCSLPLAARPRHGRLWLA